MLFTIKAIILGIIQGLTEFIPVSSSGHLVLANHFLRFELQDITFEVMLHIGTALSVIIYFRKDIIALLSSVFRFTSKDDNDVSNRKVILYLAVATFVTGVIGISAKSFIEAIFYNPLFAAIMLFITGAIVMSADFIPDGHKPAARMGFLRSAIIGIVQAFAILPGISRSGSTIAASLAVGIKREEAARFSFLLSIPAILGAAVFDIRKIAAIDASLIPGYFFGTVAAFISGYLVISMLLTLIRKRKLRYFSFYCWLLAIVTITLLLLGH